MTVNHDVAGSSPAGGARKKTVTKVTVFFQRCVPQAERDVSFGSEVRFAREVCLRHVIRNTSHHCDHREQHHYAMHNRTFPRPFGLKTRAILLNSIAKFVVLLYNKYIFDRKGMV